MLLNLPACGLNKALYFPHSGLGAVSSLTSADVADVDIGSWWPSGKYVGELVPRFAEVLQCLAANKGKLCFAELKASRDIEESSAIVAAAVAAMPKDMDPAALVWISFSAAALVGKSPFSNAATSGRLLMFAYR